MSTRPLRPPSDISQLPEDVYKHLNRIERKLDGFIIETRQRFDQVDQRFDQLDHKVDEILKRAIVISDYSDE